MPVCRSILCVDGYMPNLIALEAVLEQPDWKLVLVQSGAEALSVMADEEVVMLLVGVQLADMDGFNLLKQLREDSKWSRLPVLFLSAAGEDPVAVRRGYELGIADFLHRPLDPYVLRAKVEFLLRLVE
jgi:two-component system sensor histidine kinase/response regulator